MISFDWFWKKHAWGFIYSQPYLMRNLHVPACFDLIFVTPALVFQLMSLRWYSNFKVVLIGWGCAKSILNKTCLCFNGNYKRLNCLLLLLLYAFLMLISPKVFFIKHQINVYLCRIWPNTVMRNSFVSFFQIFNTDLLTVITLRTIAKRCFKWQYKSNFAFNVTSMPESLRLITTYCIT